MALQLLVENAVKHNEISNRRPLTVSVIAEGDTVEVSNPFSPNGEGVPEWVSDWQIWPNAISCCIKDIIVKEENHRFAVILPLI